MKYLYSVACLSDGKITAGVELAEDRDAALTAVERHFSRGMNIDIRINAVQLSWDFILAKIADVIPNEPGVPQAIMLLHSKLPKGNSEGEGGQTLN